jgi:hypothetical protein
MHLICQLTGLFLDIHFMHSNFSESKVSIELNKVRFIGPIDGRLPGKPV